MICIFDTNVFLTKHGNLWELMEYFPALDLPPKFLIGLDEEQYILEEYMDYSDAEVDPEAPIRVIVERILDGSGLFTVEDTSTQMDDLLEKQLDAAGCKPIEPQLFAVCAQINKGILVHPNPEDKNQVYRKYLEPSILPELQNSLSGASTISLYELLKILREPQEYAPNTVDDLRGLLRLTQIHGKSGEEREYIEFKSPRGTHLTQRMLRDAVKAISGMLNSREGWVLIGVVDDGTIQPFPPRYNRADAELSVDRLMINIYAEIDRIKPSPGPLVNAWPILDEARSNCIILIRVHQGNRDYLYRDICGGNFGSQFNTKYIRRGPQTIVDPANTSLV